MKLQAENAISAKISILIVCYNSLSDIALCMASVIENLRKDSVDAEVLLLDNSNDGTVEFISKNYPQVQIIDNHVNLGFAAGNNLLAENAKGEYLLLLNPDTKLYEGAIKNLISIAKAYPESGAWGGATYFPDGSREYSSLQVDPTLGRELINLFGLSRHFPGRKSLNATDELTPVLSGAFMMISKRIWDQLGGFDTEYFLYSEEVDICFRIRKLTGSMLLMSERAKVTHFVGKSSTNSGRTLLMYKGKMHYSRKHYGKIYSFFYAIVIWLYAFSRFILGWMVNLCPPNGRARNLVEKFQLVVSSPSKWISGYQDFVNDSKQSRSGV
ncbi:glycosyltransferase family 2 protein [Microbulbifer mangrovi]|uniref:glycosyltransferase family 2 protein n=1 Tax=Microbulbifer mangrovi TaxID=927787 RepID=UPI00099070D2|nr:glycosyltransferase family 2 protein [Microbulbifer mangrovi]